jgi:hypothetical protein
VTVSATGALRPVRAVVLLRLVIIDTIVRAVVLLRLVIIDTIVRAVVLLRLVIIDTIVRAVVLLRLVIIDTIFRPMREHVRILHTFFASSSSTGGPPE